MNRTVHVTFLSVLLCLCEVCLAIGTQLFSSQGLTGLKELFLGPKITDAGVGEPKQALPTRKIRNRY